MQEIFPTISDFIKTKEKCIFCLAPLQAMLTTYNAALGQNSIPLITAPVLEDKIYFNFQHPTLSEIIACSGTININNNMWKLFPSSIFGPAKNTFEEMKPYLQIYCSNKECKTEYHISSDIFKFEYYLIKPLKIYLEGFRIHNLTILNNLINKTTTIYSRKHPDSNPIVLSSMMDFESMTKEKLFNRINTISTFT